MTEPKAYPHQFFTVLGPDLTPLDPAEIMAEQFEARRIADQAAAETLARIAAEREFCANGFQPGAA